MPWGGSIRRFSGFRTQRIQIQCIAGCFLLVNLVVGASHRLPTAGQQARCDFPQDLAHRRYKGLEKATGAANAAECEAMCCDTGPLCEVWQWVEWTPWDPIPSCWIGSAGVPHVHDEQCKFVSRGRGRAANPAAPAPTLPPVVLPAATGPPIAGNRGVPLVQQAAAVKALIARVFPEAFARRVQVRVESSEPVQPPSAVAEGYFALSTSAPQPHDVGGGGSSAARLLVRGTTGVDAASGVLWFAKYFANASVSWWGDELETLQADAGIDAALAGLRSAVRVSAQGRALVRRTPYQWRYYMNTCTFGYSTVWWDWNRWQREIDWMALHGINMPLAAEGQEWVARTVFRGIGVRDDELDSFFAGPAFLPWHRMGNIAGWMGPLPRSWIDAHKHLQQRIVRRMRSLGMRPVLPGFSGLVPPALKARLFPYHSINPTRGWVDAFAPTHFVEPTDPLFKALSAAFMRRQEEAYGTDHLYSCDLYNEMQPTDLDAAYLARAAASVHGAMTAVDPRATWVLQGWTFANARRTWTPERLRAMLTAVPHGRLLVLDLYAEAFPMWSQTEGWHGTNFVWNMLHQFGGRTGMFGQLQRIARAPAEALDSNRTAAARAAAMGGGGRSAGQMRGLGLTPEAIETDPMVYELMLENIWRNDAEGPMDDSTLLSWVKRYARSRLGPRAPRGVEHAYEHAYELLAHSVYGYKGQARVKQGPSGSIFAARPALDVTAVSCCDETKLWYNTTDIVSAWRMLLQAGVQGGTALRTREAFRADIVAIGTQALSDRALHVYGALRRAIRGRDIAAFEATATTLVELLQASDELLSTQRDRLLGRWLHDARRWGTADASKLSALVGNESVDARSWASVPEGGDAGSGAGLCDIAAQERMPCKTDSEDGTETKMAKEAFSPWRVDRDEETVCELGCGCWSDHKNVGPAHAETTKRLRGGGMGKDKSVASCYRRANISDAQLYELNARTIITLWGPSKSVLHEYSYRLWAGLVRGFYLPRWRMWLTRVHAKLAKGWSDEDQAVYVRDVRRWELNWTHHFDPSQYSWKPTGDPVEVSRKLIHHFFVAEAQHSARQRHGTHVWHHDL